MTSPKEPPTPAPLSIAQLQAIGIDARDAERAVHALAADDPRAMVHELLLDGLWSDVVDEAQPQPQWIERWRELGANGFPIIDTAALERLLAAGVDLHDLTDVVRSAQVLTICNIAQLLDYPALALGWDLPPRASVHLACGSEADEEDTTGSPPRRLYPLRPDVMCRDPSGRFGEPRPLALRQWNALPQDAQTNVRTLVRGGRRAHAAALWKQHVGGELPECLAAVEVLRGLWDSGEE